jgi:hypothetical protein
MMRPVALEITAGDFAFAAVIVAIAIKALSADLSQKGSEMPNLKDPTYGRPRLGASAV